MPIKARMEENPPQSDVTESGSTPTERPTFEYSKNDATGTTTGTTSTTEASDDAVVPSAVKAETVQTEAASLSQAQKAQLRRRATQRAKTAASAEWLTNWLIKEGLSADEADQMATFAWRSAESSKRAAAAKRRQDMGLAWAEIIGGVVLLIVGLAAGWFVGLFLVPIIDGIRRLGT